MTNVKPIGPQGYTPETILDAVAKDIGEINEVFIVAFAKDGRCFQYHAGDLGTLALAALVMQEYALRYLRDPRA